MGPILLRIDTGYIRGIGVCGVSVFKVFFLIPLIELKTRFPHVEALTAFY